MTGWRAAVSAALLLWAAAPASAQDVTLTSRDGGVRIDGTLLGFDGEFYRVDTIYGELTVDGSGVRCEGPGCPSLTDFVPELRISGSATLAEVMLPGLLRAFAAREGLTVAEAPTPEGHRLLTLAEGSGAEAGRFLLRPTTADEGFADLLADEADLVVSRREIRPEEVARAAESGLGDMEGPHRSRVLALDALVPVVSPLNPLREISVTQLAQVLAGRIDNWQALGGPDAPITLHLQAPGSAMRQNLQDRVLAPARAELATPRVTHDSDGALAEAVADDRLGIGVVGQSATGPARALPLAGPFGYPLGAGRLSVKTED